MLSPLLCVYPQQLRSDLSGKQCAEGLNDLRITNLSGLKTIVTFNGAQDLRGTITPFGQRFLKYVCDEETRAK
jgi:hypothetical protein